MMYNFVYSRLFREAYINIKRSLSRKDGIQIFLNVHSFLLVAFAIREKKEYSILIKNNNNLEKQFYVGLKRFYNILKHNYLAEEIMNSITVPEGQEVENPTFMSIDNIPSDSRYEDEKKSYKQYIEGKTIIDIVEKVYKETDLLIEKEKKLVKLKKTLNEKLITKDEYDKKKAELLNL